MAYPIALLHTFGVYLSALTSANASTERVNIYWTPVRKEA